MFAARATLLLKKLNPLLQTHPICSKLIPFALNSSAARVAISRLLRSLHFACHLPDPPSFLSMRPTLLLLLLLLLFPYSSHAQRSPFKLLVFNIPQKMRYPSAIVTLDISFSSPVLHPAGSIFTLTYPSLATPPTAPTTASLF